ncbi:hypothetical protein KR059_004370, partial [Drosophila kikkawai]
QSTLDVRLEYINNIPGEEETLVAFNLRVVGKERLLNGTFTCLVDLDEHHVGTIDLYSFKNGEWAQSYIKVQTTPCEIFTKYIHKYYFLPNADTDVPTSGDNCLKKGEYYLKKIQIAVVDWPTFLGRGLTKFVLSMKSLEGKRVGGFELICTVSDKAT